MKNINKEKETLLHLISGFFIGVIFITGLSDYSPDQLKASVLNTTEFSEAKTSSDQENTAKSDDDYKNFKLYPGIEKYIYDNSYLKLRDSKRILKNTLGPSLYNKLDQDFPFKSNTYPINLEKFKNFITKHTVISVEEFNSMFNFKIKDLSRIFLDREAAYQIIDSLDISQSDNKMLKKLVHEEAVKTIKSKYFSLAKTVESNYQNILVDLSDVEKILSKNSKFEQKEDKKLLQYFNSEVTNTKDSNFINLETSVRIIQISSDLNREEIIEQIPKLYLKND